MSTPSSPDNPPSSPKSWFGSRSAAEVAAQRDRKKADKLARTLQASQRNTLIARRDVLNYFDHARSLGTLVFVDTVPLCMNAVLCVTVGTLALFMDGGGTLNDSGGSCGSLVHFYVLCLMGMSYILLGLMSFVAMGYRVVLDVSAPFFALVCILVGYCATWFFFGLPAFLVWFSVLVSPNPDPKSSTMTCLANSKLMFGACGLDWGVSLHFPCAPPFGYTREAAPATFFLLTYARIFFLFPKHTLPHPLFQPLLPSSLSWRPFSVASC